MSNEAFLNALKELGQAVSKLEHEIATTKVNSADTPDEHSHCAKGRGIASTCGTFIALSLFALILGAGLLITAQSTAKGIHFCLTERVLFSFVVFIVALAAYLASVAREIVKVLAATSGTKNSKDRQQKTENLVLITIVEGSLLLLGVMILWRLFHGPYALWLTPYCSDVFIPAYMAAILLAMVVLHLRAWYLVFFASRAG